MEEKFTLPADAKPLWFRVWNTAPGGALEFEAYDGPVEDDDACGGGSGGHYADGPVDVAWRDGDKDGFNRLPQELRADLSDFFEDAREAHLSLYDPKYN